MSRTYFQSRAILHTAALTAALLGTACSDSTGPSRGEGSAGASPEAQLPGGTPTTPADTTAAPGDTTASPGDTTTESVPLRPAFAVQRAPGVWDNPGVTLDLYPPTCEGLSSRRSFNINQPFPKARDAIPGVTETDRVWFRFQIYGALDATTATLGYLTSYANNSSEMLVYTSGWYQKYANDKAQGVIYPGGWIDTRPGGTTWANSNEQRVSLNFPGFYYTVLEVYWDNRAGVGPGRRRWSSGPICSV